MKTAWIDSQNRIISFSVLTRGEIYREEEKQFWQQILTLMRAGYRVQ